MTITSNIFPGIQNWAASTAYSTLGTFVNNGGNAYYLVGTGTSGTGGPAGTGALIADGSCAWSYAAAISYTSLAAWESGIPTTLTQPIVGQLWNLGTLTTTAGTSFLSLTGHTTTNTNNITLIAASGQSIRDSLASQTTPLYFNTSKGVSFSLPGGTGNTNYINISDSNVIIDGIQFQDPNSTSASSIIGGTGSNIIIRNCLLDGYAQSSNSIIQLSGSATIYNSLILDRTAGGTSPSIYIGSAIGSVESTVTNCTIVSLNSSGGSATSTSNVNVQATQETSNSITINWVIPDLQIRNTAIFGYVTASSINTQSFDYCCFSNSSVGSGINNGNNLYSKVAANQFVSATTDFRLKSTADCVNAGVTDLIDVPSDNDIAYTIRPQGTSWDIGAWEYRNPYTITAISSLLKLISKSLISFINLTPTALTTDVDPINPVTAVQATETTTSVSLNWTAPSSTPPSSEFILLDPVTINPVTSLSSTVASSTVVNLAWTAPTSYTAIYLYADNSAGFSFVGRSSFNIIQVKGNANLITPNGFLGVSQFFLPSVTASLSSKTFTSGSAKFLSLTTVSSVSDFFVFAESGFSSVSGIIGIPSTTSVVVDWSPPTISSSFFILTCKSTIFSGNGVISQSTNNYILPIFSKSNLIQQNLINLDTYTVCLVSDYLYYPGIIPPTFFVITSITISQNTNIATTNSCNILVLNSVTTSAPQQLISVIGNILNINLIGRASTLAANTKSNILNLFCNGTLITYASNSISNLLSINVSSVFVFKTAFISNATFNNITSSASLIQANGASGNPQVFPLTNSAQLVQLYFFVSSASILTLQLLSHVTQNINASSTQSVEVLNSNIQINLYNLIQSISSLQNLIAIGILPLTCNGTNSFFVINPNITTYPINVAIGNGNILSLSVVLPINYSLQAENYVTITADGTDLSLTGDVSKNIISQSTNAIGTTSQAEWVSSYLYYNTFNSIFSITSNSFAALLGEASAVNNINISISSVTNQFIAASLSRHFMDIHIIGNIGIGASATLNIFTMICGPTQNYIIAADPYILYLKVDPPFLDTLLLMDASHVTALIQQDLASLVQNINIYGTSTALNTIVSTQINNINITSASQINQYNISQSLTSINTSVTGVLNQFYTSSGLVNFVFQAVGIAIGNRGASTNNNNYASNQNIPYVSVGVITPNIIINQTHAAQAICNIPFNLAAFAGVGETTVASANFFVVNSNSSLLTQLQAAVGFGTLNSPIVQIALQQFDLVNGLANYQITTADITVQQDVNVSASNIFALIPTINSVLTTPTISANNILGFSCLANAVINGSKFSASVNCDPDLTAVGMAVQQDIAYSINNINFIGKANLWKTPIGYVEGMHNIWWSS